MYVNSLPAGFEDDPLKTGIRPLEEVQQTRTAVYGGFTRADATHIVTSMAESAGQNVEALGEIGAQFQQAMDADPAIRAHMDELCREKTGRGMDEYVAELTAKLSPAFQESAGEKEAAVGTQFDSGGNGQTVAFMGLGPTEIVIIGIIAVLLFGKRLPDVLRGLGKGIRGFKEEVQGVKDSIENAGTGHGDGDEEDEPQVGDGTEVDDEEDGTHGGPKK